MNGKKVISAESKPKLPDVFPGADEKTPSRSEYFSWINNTNEGASSAQTLVNLAFFRFLHDEYGMMLDLYVFDAGAIDGKRFYGKMKSERFQKHFPAGFGPIAEKASEMGTRIGLWGGPDGFGNTGEAAQERVEMMVSLCRDFGFELFKFDGVCGCPVPENEKYFIQMMTRCRQYVPSLILLNHRLAFTPEGLRHATTFLWEGRETYIDVHASNTETAPHHRAGTLHRGLPPNLSRLCEDHGVCLSSQLDNWDDELILQTFNRALIVSPQIYGNPWLLRDEEYPKLARIFNLQRKFRSILVSGMVLPEDRYGECAVSRGDGKQRLVTLRNLSWEYRTFEIDLSTLGLTLRDSIEVRRFHPGEYYYGVFTSEDKILVKLEPYRACLLYAGIPCGEPYLPGEEFEVIRDLPGKPVQIDRISLPPHTLPPVRKVAELSSCAAIPPNADALYEATVFAADNNCLEYRSLARSGESAIPEVQDARRAFFEQPILRHRGVCDRYLFDGDETTYFEAKLQTGITRIQDCCFRLDLGESTRVDELVIRTDDYFGLWPLLPEEGFYAFVSEDLKTWRRITFLAETTIHIPVGGNIRYVKLPVFPRKMISVEGYTDGAALPSAHWRASNLFQDHFKTVKAWQGAVVLPEILPESKLCIALDGVHGPEGAYAAVMLGDTLLGCPDRAPSYLSNNWEYYTAPVDAFYTYYLPLRQEWAGRTLNVYVLGSQPEHCDFPVRVYVADTPRTVRRESVILPASASETDAHRSGRE